jgi:hypothetical protein
MPNGSMMFPALNWQLAEMGRKANVRGFLNWGAIARHRRHVADGIAVVWASALMNSR